MGNEDLQRGPGGSLWCREHKCYHTGPLDLAQGLALQVIRNRFKLSPRQAKRYGFEINGDIMFVPHREPDGWHCVRYRWRMDGKTLWLERPDKRVTSSLN